jgi:hemerythrin superfamily protein
MDIYQVLTKEHNEMKGLLQRLVNATKADADTKNLLDEIEFNLIPHARAEEVVFYNPLRTLDTTKDAVMHGYSEHMQSEVLLHTLRGLNSINVEWETAVKKLQEDLLHHMEEEENRIFGLARMELSQEEANQMAKAFHQIKPKYRDQGSFKNSAEFILNLLPPRFTGTQEISKSA